jgi:REP element-mobilizing transposase RayT
MPGGIYYVVKRGRHPGQPIFRDAFDYAIFEKLLALALARYRYRLHAFCWEPEAIHLVIQVSGRPIGRFLQWLCSWYSRSASEDVTKETVWERTHQAVHVEPGQALLRLIRYVHLRGAVNTGIAADPADSALSSHRAYLGMVSIPWVTTSLALGVLAPSLEQSRLEYRRLMQRSREGLAQLSSEVEGSQRRRSEFFEWASIVGRNVESLQIRAAPVALRKDSRV